VIEIPAFPTVGVVTQPAAFAESTLVNVTASMAVDAVFTRLAKVMRYVAVLAGRKLVKAQQRKIREIVFERTRFAPGVGGMALLAAAAFSAGVDIDTTVAVDAEVGCRGLLDWEGVTQFAIQVGVGAV